MAAHYIVRVTGNISLDPELSTCRSSFRTARAALDSPGRSFGRAIGESRRQRRRLQLAVALRRPGGRMGAYGSAKATASAIICCSAASLSRRWSRFSRRRHAVCSNRPTKRRRRFPRLAIQRCGPDAARSPAPPVEEAAQISRPFPSGGVATLFWKRLRRSPHVGELARKQRVLRRMGSGNCATASTSTGPIAQPQSTNASIDPDERSLRRSTLTLRRCPAGAARGPNGLWETRGKPLPTIAT